MLCRMNGDSRACSLGVTTKRCSSVAVRLAAEAHDQVERDGDGDRPVASREAVQQREDRPEQRHHR